MSASFRYCILAALGLSAAWSQISAGNIVGVVEDATGAVVPNAQVRARQTATGETREAITGATGEFNLPFLHVGPYTVTAVANGFKTKTLSGITLQVDQTINLRIALEVGASTETVEVTGAAPLVDSVTSSLGQVIENKAIIDMPLNGRNPFALGLLSGNTTPMFGMGSNLPFIAGGGRFSANEVTLDGIDNNTVSNGGAIGRNGIALLPSVDAVQEFKVKTNAFSAEFGHAAGAVISAAIKSGSNDYHGTAFEFLRNDKLDANNFFTNAAGLPKAAFRQNQFGGVFGGRIIRNKTFFFVDYQGTRQRTASASSIGSVPPTAIRNGDLSLLRTPIYDPRSRQVAANGTVVSTPFPNAIIPPALINPSSAAILKLIPEPNFGAPGSLSRNFFRQIPRGFDQDQWDVRIDHAVTSSNNLFGRISKSNQTNPQPGTFDGFIGGSSNLVRD